MSCLLGGGILLSDAWEKKGGIIPQVFGWEMGRRRRRVKNIWGVCKRECQGRGRYFSRSKSPTRRYFLGEIWAFSPNFPELFSRLGGKQINRLSSSLFLLRCGEKNTAISFSAVSKEIFVLFLFPIHFSGNWRSSFGFPAESPSIN